MAKPYFIIKIEKVVKMESSDFPRHPIDMRNETIFTTDLTPEEAVEIMGQIIERRKQHGR